MSTEVVLMYVNMRDIQLDNITGQKKVTQLYLDNLKQHLGSKSTKTYIGERDFINRERLFDYFNGWQDGYGGFTYAFKDKDRLIEYVKNQETHHRNTTFREEFIKLLNEHGIEFNEKYLL